MWDDKINKKIKDAADQYHPAYDDNAWNKMELLLNEHLPVKDNDRRRYFLFLLLLLLVGGSFFGFYKYNNSKNKGLQHATSKNSIQDIPLPENKSNYTSKNSSIKTIVSVETNYKDTQLKNTGKNHFTNNNKRNLISSINEKKSKTFSVENVTNTNATVGANKNEINNQGDEPSTDPSNQDQEKKNDDVAAANKEATAKMNDTTNDKEILKSDFDHKTSPKKKGSHTKSTFSENFAVYFSWGPDLSIAGLDKAGKVTLDYGLGLRYNLSSKITLHTGFYIADKIYSANKNEYHAPSSAGYNYLYKIDANCKVYEIPVTASYNFRKVKKHQWFIGGGLSSYLMKKESYDYYYKYPSSGYVYTKSWSISNKNQHYFAVLDLSTGYQYNFNKRVAVIGEPYLKIPIEGVGAGKVRLNSGGVLFTLSVKPF
ncbi:MAG: hypothetical protein M3139_01550 [Bacteroidota bacterium]|nr:hypothetical protein [Bacteroidota bacterium]